MAQSIIEDAFQSFVKAGYPAGTTVDQHRQLRQAFYAGFGIACEKCVNTAGNLTEDQAMAVLASIAKELEAYIGSLLPKN